VVREYLLPLFNKDNRKMLKEKRHTDMNSPKRRGKRLPLSLESKRGSQE
jgi:hypothetical protein